MAMTQAEIDALAKAMVQAFKQSSVSGFSASNPTGGARDPMRNQNRPGDFRNPAFQRNVQRQNDAMKDAVDALNNLRKGLSLADRRWGRSSKVLLSTSSDISARMRELNDTFDSSASALQFWSSKTGTSLLKLEKQAIQLRRKLEDATISTKDRLKAEQELVEVEKERTKQLAGEFPAALEKTSNIVKAFGIILLNTARLVYDDFRTQLGSAGIGGFAQNVIDSVMLGVDPGELSRISKENRAAQIALMGTTNNVNEIFDQTRRNYGELILRTKSATEATELYASAATSLVTSGIKPSEQAIMAQVRESDRLAKMSGMTALEFTKLTESLGENADISFMLQKLNQKERKQRLETYQYTIAYNRAMGMSTEQAKRAAEAMASMATKGPLERIKQATKAAAAASALGIAGGEDYRRIMIRGGPKNEAEAKIVSDFSDAMATQLQEARASGDIARELMIDRIYSGELDSTFGKDSPHARALEDAASVNQQQFDNLSLTAESAAKFLDQFGISLGGALQALDVASGAIKNFALGEAASTAVGTAGGLFVASKLIPGLGKMFSSGATRGATGILPKLAKGAGLVGGIGMAGADTLQLLNGDTSAGNIGSLIGSAVGGVAGGVIGSVVAPGVGTAAGAGWGMTAGNALGGWIGGLFDEETTAATIETLEKTAETSAKQLTAVDITHKKMDQQTELLTQMAEALATDSQEARLRAMDRNARRPAQYGQGQ